MSSYIGRVGADEVADLDIIDRGGRDDVGGVLSGVHSIAEIKWDLERYGNVRACVGFVCLATGTESTMGRIGPGSTAQKRSFVFLLQSLFPVVVER